MISIQVIRFELLKLLMQIQGQAFTFESITQETEKLIDYILNGRASIPAPYTLSTAEDRSKH